MEAVVNERVAGFLPARDVRRVGHGVRAEQQFGAVDEPAVLGAEVGVIEPGVGEQRDGVGDFLYLGRREIAARFQIEIRVAERREEPKPAAEERRGFAVLVARGANDPQQVFLRPREQRGR